MKAATGQLRNIAAAGLLVVVGAATARADTPANYSVDCTKVDKKGRHYALVEAQVSDKEIPLFADKNAISLMLDGLLMPVADKCQDEELITDVDVHAVSSTGTQFRASYNYEASSWHYGVNEIGKARKWK